MKRLKRSIEAFVLSLTMLLSFPMTGVKAEENYETEVISGVPVVMSADDNDTENLNETEEENNQLGLSSVSKSIDTQGTSTSLSEQTVYNRIIAQKSRYPEGMTWTNANPTGGYLFHGYLYRNLKMYGYGCASFAFEMSDIAFGSSISNPLPAIDHRDWSNVKVGDVLRINNNTHSVIVLSVNGDIATVAEGNYNSSIHWGRKIRLSDYSSSSLNYITTRWTASVTDTTTSSTATATSSAAKTTSSAKSSSSSTNLVTSSQVTSEVTVSYSTHVESYGWLDYVKNGGMSGTVGESKRLEAIKIKVSGVSNLGIQYTTHCQSYGWLPWSSNGEMSGTEGESKRLEAIKIQLTGANKDNYDVYYRVQVQNYGWLDWAKNGEASGTAGQSKRLETIQIVVVKKGASINESMGKTVSSQSKAYITSGSVETVVAGSTSTNVEYRTHVQSYGWQGWKYNGSVSGTSGESKRLEGICIKLTNQQYSGNIVYMTHVESYGWEKSWKSNGALSGTSGQSKRLEAIRIKLTDEMAEHYDVYYRVHAQSYGWLGWAKNGEPSGTSGQSKRLEAIQIVLVPKGSSAPAVNYGGVLSRTTTAYVAK